MAGEKRVQDQEESLLSETVVLVDIEGTTTSISFVKETLFPYVRENLKEYIEKKWEDEEFKKDLEKLKEQAKKDEEDKVEGFVPLTGANPEEERGSLLKNILWQMDRDRKTGALKQLQGHMWREAYNSGSVKGHVYDDVPKALETWNNDGRKIYVYSSGSVEAQKLLFGHSVHGDLLKHFNGFFDTEVGAKQESNSYKNILSKIAAEASSVLFLTDVVKEAEAAKEAGLSTIIVVREGNAPLTSEESVAFTTVKSFSDLTFQSAAKRQKRTESELEKKESKPASSTNDPMDTSEDVEMADVSEKKPEKVEIKEVTESEQDETAKSQNQDKPEVSAKPDKPITTDTKESSVEKVVESSAEEKVTPPAKSTETKENAEISESAQNTTVEKTGEPVSAAKEKEAEKSLVSEKTVEESAEAVKNETKTVSAETNSAAGEAMEVSASEPKSKPEEPVVNKENKTDEPAQDTNDTKPETPSENTVKNVQEESVNKESKKETPAECTKPESEKMDVDEPCAKVNSTTVERTKAESEEVSTNVTKEEPAKTEETPVAETAKNGDVTETAKNKAAAPTITEPETTDNKENVKEETKPSTEATTEKKSEPEVKTQEKSESKLSNEAAKESAAEVVTEDKKSEENAEAKSQESSKEATASGETVVEEVKEKTTVDSEQQKLNGTAQNGDVEVPVSDDKLHTNGLNEESAKEKLGATSSDATSAQNGEPESSSEASAESIKVKKVVDSTVADGAGEPDVVPPVVVAATS